MLLVSPGEDLVTKQVYKELGGTDETLLGEDISTRIEMLQSKESDDSEENE